MDSFACVVKKSNFTKLPVCILYMVVFLSMKQCKPPLSPPLSFVTVFANFQVVSSSIYIVTQLGFTIQYDSVKAPVTLWCNNLSLAGE